MKTRLLAAFAALVLTATVTADDPKLPAFLETGKEYSFQLADNAKLTDFSGHATILSAPQAGWVRIEYFRIIGWAAGSQPPKDMSPKRQVWLNLSLVVAVDVVAVEDAKPPARKESKE